MIKVYFALMILLALTLGLAFFDLGPLNSILNLSIATFKAGLVVYFFMHLKTGPALTRVIAGLGVFWLGVLITLGLTDYISRAWTHLPGQWPQTSAEISGKS